MRHALYEAANSHLRISKKWSSLRAWGLKLGKRVGMKKACVAVARKLAIIMCGSMSGISNTAGKQRLPLPGKGFPLYSAEDVGMVSPFRSLCCVASCKHALLAWTT
jgi:hypothetical protein